MQQLTTMAVEDAGAAYWDLETNTPFYGSGTAGRIETTALVVQLLTRHSTISTKKDPAIQALIERGTLFLLRKKDQYGVWHSTQTTINVLDTFLVALSDGKTNEQTSVKVTINGRAVKEVPILPDQIEPVTINLSGMTDSLTNRVEVRSGSGPAVMSQIVASHYVSWRDAEGLGRKENKSRALKLEYRCNKTMPEIMEEVKCSVGTESIGSKAYGMLLAEIGIPPGADISRESLEKARALDSSISHFEVLPDRIVFYMWSKPGGNNFDFSFKPRYAIKAQTPASIVYDYYDPESNAIVRPLSFSVK